MKALTLLGFVFSSIAVFGQQPYYDVTAGNGNGIRFWQSDAYKIHMGSGTEYHYGPVTDYSIKMNIGADPGRGWTWGILEGIPVAALSNAGNMQIAGSFTIGGNFILPSVTGNKQIYTWSSGDANWRIGMSATPGFTTSMATSHVQYLTYSTGAGQGFALGVNGGQSSFEITGIDHNAFFRGSIGIGTIPGAKLSLRGSTNSQGLVIGNCDVSGYQSHLGFTTADQSRLGLATESYFNVYNDGKWNFNSANTNGITLPISFSTNGASRIFIKADGHVGIGTTNPNEALTVNGTIYGREVKVDLSVPGPDYVFESDYSLLSLKELKKYIETHRHLPEVPSAKEMESNGIQLGEMNILLLKKIEELTLHLIKKEQRIDDLENKFNEFEMKLK